MTPSQIVFDTPDGQHLTRSGNVSTSYLIAQATAEFGQIQVKDSTDGDLMLDLEPRPEQTLAVLQAARLNTQLIYDQLASLNDDNPMHDAKDHIKAALALIETEIQNVSAEPSNG
jgi:hypothetical protein